MSDKKYYDIILIYWVYGSVISLK